jgi:glycosyltransferase involved in cell wall biosynthesis
MSRLYAQAHAFVLPSIYEGYSVSAIEAAAYGLPLVMTDVGGAQDLINNGGCGILLPPAIADLALPSVKEIEQVGLAAENGATAALERAFAEVAANRAHWTQRGLDARFNVRTLDEAIDAYLAVAGAVTARL